MEFMKGCVDVWMDVCFDEFLKGYFDGCVG
jgi:hypothetical protein